MSLVENRPRMTIEEFVKWAEAQPEGRYELVDGEVIQMPSEGGLHNLVKLNIAVALRSAVAAAGFKGVVFTDGMTVKIDGSRGREPDALITAGPVADLESLIIVDPLIVVEVISPNSKSIDTSAKLADYFAVPSVAHYLVVDPVAKSALLHSRTGGPGFLTSIVRSGTFRVDPPGLELKVDDFFAIG